MHRTAVVARAFAAAAVLATIAAPAAHATYAPPTAKELREAALPILSQYLPADDMPGARRVWLTRADRLRSVDPEVLAMRVRGLRPELPVEVVAEPEVAARRARAALPMGRRLCVVGSVYLAGAARRVLGRIDR